MEFIAIGVDPTEGPDTLRQYRDRQGYPWQHYQWAPEALKAYDITIQSTKLAVDGDGVVIFRGGYGVNSAEVWRRVFQELASP